MPHLRSVAVTLAATLLAGCGTSTELPGEPVDDSPAGRFFTALAAGEDVGDLVVPRSPAARYAGFQRQLAQARADSDVEPRPANARRSGAGYLLCEDVGRDAGNTAPQPRCAEVTRVVLEGDKVRGFRVDGKPIRDRLVPAGEPVDAGAAGRVRLVAAYGQPSTGGLWVLFRVRTAGQQVVLGLDEATYAQGRDGAGMQVLPVTTGGTVAAGSDSTVAVVVPGGSLRVPLTAGGEAVEVTLPVG